MRFRSLTQHVPPDWLATRVARVHERLLRRDIEGGPVPEHVAIIQDGNRRYARKRGDAAPEGHRAGARTTANVLSWCEELGVAELTLYAFSTENFDRPDEEIEPLFDLIEGKLREFADADRVHEKEVGIRVIGEMDRLPDRVQESVAYAERRTRGYDRFRLNIALAYGGRAELLGAARDVTQSVADGDIDPSEVDVSEIERRLPDGPVRDVDLIVRTGGAERTSNFLPWHADGNEAAVFFCTPYWPAFSKVDFLRGVRTYQARERSWRHTRVERAVALVGAVTEMSAADGRAVAERLRAQLPSSAANRVEVATERREGDTSN